jgi:hypothetical protein
MWSRYGKVCHKHGVCTEVYIRICINACVEVVRGYIVGGIYSFIHAHSIHHLHTTPMNTPDVGAVRWAAYPKEL